MTRQRTPRPTARAVGFHSLALAALAACGGAQAGAFSGGHVVAYRVDTTGTGALPVVLEELRADGTPVQSVALPTSGSPLTASTTGSEGLLTRSADGACLAVPGYAVAAGGSDPKAATAAAAPRAVAAVSAAGNMDSSTTLGGTAFSGDAVRSAVTADCSAFWISGAGASAANRGLWYATLGATTATQLNTTNAQGSAIAAGQLYTAFAGGGTLNRIGTGLPTSGAPTTAALPGVGAANYRGIAFLDQDAGVAGVDTLYLAANNDGTGKIRKYSFDGTTWTARGAVALAGVHGLVAHDIGGGAVMVLATGSDGRLYRLFDRSGLTGTLAAAPEELARPAAGVFYGLAWSPEASPPASAPDAPTGVQATPSGNSVTVQWAAPAAGPAPAYYVLEVSRDGFATVDATALVYGTQHTLGNLAVGSATARVRAVNSRGGSASAVSASFVSAAPPGTTLAQNTAIAGVVGDPTDPWATNGLSFTVSDPVDAAASLVVTATSSQPGVVPAGGIAISRSGGTATLRITPTGVGYADITVQVANGAGATISRTIKYAASAYGSGTATRWYSGRSDGSTALLLDAGTLVVGDDEAPAQDASGNALPGGNAWSAYAPGASGQPLAPLVVDAGLGLASGALQTEAQCTTAGFTGISAGNCKADGEVDIEASFAIGSTVYVAGSHSNSKSGNSRPDRWRLFALQASGSGATTALATSGYYQWLREDLRTWDANGAATHGLGAHYLGLVDSSAGGASGAPENPNLAGFSIEGMSTSPGDTAAWLGFRAPLVSAPGQPAVAAGSAAGRTHALIVPVANFAALATSAGGGTKGSASFGAPIRLDLGGRGIREIRKNAAQEYLILAGPPDSATGTAPKDFRLYSWNGGVDATGRAIHLRLRDANLAPLTPPASACSAEGLAQLPASLDAGGTVDLIADCGDADFYNDGQAAKDLPYAAWKKFRADPVALAPLASVTLGSLTAGASTLALQATSAQATRLYAVALPAAAAAPSWEQVVQGLDGAGNTAPWASGPVALAGGADTNVQATGLAASTAYVVYGVTVTAAGVAGSVAAQPFSTTAPGVPQTIAFGALADRLLGTAPFTVSATGGASGQPVVIASTTPAVCQVRTEADPPPSTTVTLIAPGTCTLRATQASGAGYDAAAPVDRSFAVALPAASGTTLAGSGGLQGAVAGGAWQFAANSSGFQAAGALPQLPAGYSFPWGSFSFALINGAPGSTANVSISLPSAAPANTVLWKYGRTATQPQPHWFTVAGSFSPDRRTVTFALTDGGAGDDDLVANSVIIDPVLPGVPMAGAPAPAAIPTLGDAARWWLVLAVAGLAALRLRTLRGRR